MTDPQPAVSDDLAHDEAPADADPQRAALTPAERISLALGVTPSAAEATRD